MSAAILLTHRFPSHPGESLLRRLLEWLQRVGERRRPSAFTASSAEVPVAEKVH
jgi:hypothetical protein